MVRIRNTFLLALALTTAGLLSALSLRAPLGVGDSVPAGTLQTAAGATVEFPALVAGQPTVLIFYRGGWCPSCTKHLSGLAEITGDLKDAGFELVAISPDQPSKLRARPTLEAVPYTLLSDSPMRVSEAFGIAFKVEDALVAKYKNEYGIDLEGDSGQTHHLLPHPAVFIVDGTGQIHYAHVDPDYRVRLDPAAVLAAAKAVTTSGS